jgi:RNA polymerase sigma-70 factor (ECF subfamily)
MSRSGDGEFEALFRAEYGRVVAAVRWVVRSDAVAEEVAQDAFCRALERWERVRSHERPAAWVQLVAVRLAVRVARRRRRGDALTPSWSPAAVDGAVDLDLMRAIEALTPRQREAVVLHHLVDLSVADTAAAMRVRDGTVKTLLSRARGEMAAALGDAREEVRDDAR